MQFFYATAAIAMSVGISTFASYDKEVQLHSDNWNTKVEIAEFQKKVAKNALRREKEMSPGKFPSPAKNKTAKLSDDLIEGAFNGGYRSLDFVTVTLDSAGNLYATASNKAYSLGNISGTTTAAVQDLFDDIPQSPRLTLTQSGTAKAGLSAVSSVKTASVQSSDDDDGNYVSRTVAAQTADAGQTVATLTATLAHASQSSATGSITARLSAASNLF